MEHRQPQNAGQKSAVRTSVRSHAVRARISFQRANYCLASLTSYHSLPLSYYSRLYCIIRIMYISDNSQGDIYSYGRLLSAQICRRHTSTAASIRKYRTFLLHSIPKLSSTGLVQTQHSSSVPVKGARFFQPASITLHKRPGHHKN